MGCVFRESWAQPDCGPCSCHEPVPLPAGLPSCRAPLRQRSLFPYQKRQGTLVGGARMSCLRAGWQGPRATRGGQDSSWAGGSRVETTTGLCPAHPTAQVTMSPRKALEMGAGELKSGGY